MATKLEFIQPNTRYEDWRVLLHGRCVGSVWRGGDSFYIANVTRPVKVATKDAAFRAARKQATSIAFDPLGGKAT